uniref:Uncharacterized protein n=1 Tax=Knipowitschia caucasica TaxID=637954 RepID=A0AAV2ISG0_KNICA
MKTEVRRKVAQARAAIEGTSADCAPVPVILTAMQQRICNLLGEATIISIPAGDSDAEITLPVTAAATVTLTETLPAGTAAVCEDDSKSLNVEATYHSLEDPGVGVVEYCTTTVEGAAPTMVTAVEAPVEMLASSSESLPQTQAKPQELKSRIALNSARLLQEQRVTNVHIRQIAQHLEGHTELLQMMRRSQEAQAFAQERQAQALEGTQAALLALVQILRPALKDIRTVPNSTGASGDSKTPHKVKRGISGLDLYAEDRKRDPVSAAMLTARSDRLNGHFALAKAKAACLVIGLSWNRRIENGIQSRRQP